MEFVLAWRPPPPKSTCLNKQLLFLFTLVLVHPASTLALGECHPHRRMELLQWELGILACTNTHQVGILHWPRPASFHFVERAPVPASANLQDPDITFPLPLSKLFFKSLLSYPCSPLTFSSTTSLLCQLSLSLPWGLHTQLQGDREYAVSFVWFPFDPCCFLCCLVGTRTGIQVTQAQTWELRTSRNFSVPGTAGNLG